MNIAIPVIESSQVAAARREAVNRAHSLGFGEVEAGEVAIVVTEMARNLINHAQGGELLLGELDRGGVGGLEVIALDKGPGISDVAASLRDGYSTGGTAGTGLGAIRRLAGEFDIHSAPGKGTAILARLWSRPLAGALLRDPLEVGTVSAVKEGEEVCGDRAAVFQRPDRSLLVVVDGLGHGPMARNAADAAVEAVEANREAGPVQLLELAHQALRASRGAAVAIAEVRPSRQSLSYCGVGNIAGVVLSRGTSQHLVSLNGTVGHQVRKFQEFTYPLADDALLVMHSDGLTTRWDLEAYSGLASRDPGLIAAVLYRDFARGRDDVTVLVARYRRH